MNVKYSCPLGIQCMCPGFVPLLVSRNVIILQQGEENTKRVTEQGEVVLVTEHRILDGGNRKGSIVIRVGISSTRHGHMEIITTHVNN